ncbi:hypothetical protein JHD50_00960 [Sulfurimonas sp. MAG313]|nr:hypothetical protein [Sulfurimonas sp. MAG313]MDF1879880.1 hypothetical protein [Sulfurimonas sp. MAG313]
MTRLFAKVLLVGVLSLNTFAFAQETCYSVQLASIFNVNNRYIKEAAYPSTCKLISLSNLKAVRCGCFDDKIEAIKALKLHRKKYHGAILVRTYKSRFEKKPYIQTQKKQKTKALPQKTVPKPSSKQIRPLKKPKKQANIFDKEILSFLSEGEFSIQGHVDLTAQGYMQRPPDKHKANLTASGEVELDYVYEDITLVGKLYIQADSYDMKESSQKNKRSFIRLDELYVKQDFEDDQIMFGKNIRFWGALETKNITDVFNPNDFRSDIFKTDKLGVWNLAYTHYTQTGELALIIKLQEQDRKLAGLPYVYYVLPKDITDPASGQSFPINYSSELHADQDVNRPSFFMKYSGSTDTEVAWDYAIIFENGYDSQRYFRQLIPNASFTAVDTQENAYLVNKLMTYNTVVLGSTLLKLEAVYADVISDDVISDYYHIGLGVEHTLIQFYKEADLGLIAEYFNYGTLENDPKKYDDLRLFETFQNDLFLGARYSFNQGNDASIIGGGIFDLEYNEQVYYIEYESRIADTFKLNIDYQIINPSKNTPTAFSIIGKHQRLGAQIGYYF